MPVAYPGTDTEQIVARDHQYVVRNYGRYPLVVSRADGVYLHGEDGRKYLDFVSGIGVMALGHSHPRVVAAIADQIGTLVHCSNLYYHPLQGEVAQLLSELSGLQRTFFCNSGAESVEAALKIAKGYGRARDSGKTEIVALQESFGGRTLGSISVTGQPKYREPFEPVIPGVRFIEPNDLGALEAAMGDQTAGIVFEPILGEGGVIEISAEFAALARRLATDHDALLICDEVQCGMGRTGQAFAFQHWGAGFLPDVITLAKPLAAGLPIGAVVCSEAAAAVLAPGMHGSTFGGGALACRVAREFLSMLPELMPHVQDVSAYFRARLADLAASYDFVDGLRGRGLMVGLELNIPGGGFVPRAQELGLLMNCTAGNILRFLPPFVIEREHVDEAIAALDEAFRQGPPDGAS
ncbi:MAG: aspartate aminotransferase family protein [Acidobacteriia bacterium]|nr:aspartate aminotransferase family protein [Terriglobia bacterium]MYG01663.1 aspartate aminotransferase family protein [Terriglobia bacterium]MYK12233.1 aspartate aminotransferase family protein [Terriglobia bacterium]